MTSQYLKKLQKSGCTCLSYGLESGSQKVLDRMNKGIKIADAEKIIRNTLKAGIQVMVNFMFGFPGEDDADFKESIQFMQRNGKYITRVNPMTQFCGFGKGGFVYEHPDVFGIKLTGVDEYCESTDGKNTYPERLKRFERFYEAASALRMKSLSSIKHCKYMLLGDYYFFKKEYHTALKNYKFSYNHESKNKYVHDRMESSKRKCLKPPTQDTYF